MKKAIGNDEQNESCQTGKGEDYWKYTQNKVTQLERMWLDRTPARG